MTLPLDDLIAHELEGCVCGPVLVPIVTGDGTRSQIVIHRRLDGRTQNSPHVSGPPDLGRSGGP